MIINAAHAIKGHTYAGSGVIRVETLPEKDFCIITICDNGSGIDSDNLNKIFDPFFTTKPVGQGTGLGLSISHNIIVDKHQGKISVESQFGEGTCFKIALPYSHEETTR